MELFTRRPAGNHGHKAGGRLLGALSVAAALAWTAGTASATWSIIIIDTRTGEVAIGSATCLTSFDLQANTPVLIVGVGGATAQSAVDQDATNRTLIRDQLYLGTAPSQILNLLAAKEGGTHQSRQYGIADTRGRTVTFSGTGDSPWAGGLTGQIGDLVYAVQGNILVGPDVVGKAVEEILKPQGDVPDKLMRAMEKAAQYGGDSRCTVFTKSAHIAYMLVGRAGDRDASNGNYLIPQVAQTIAAADLNGDGMPELLLGASGGIAALRNLSMPGRAPMFGTAVVTPTGGISFRDLITADVNKDGKADVIGTDFANDRIQVLKGNGTLTLTGAVMYPAGDGPAGLVAADFNGDGFPDIATGNSIGGTVSVLLNNGDGTFAPAVNYPAGAGSALVQAGDVDGDGDIDLVAGSTSARTLVVLRNNGSGIFTPDAGVSFSTGPVGMAVADLNKDGRAEIILGLSTETNLRVRSLTDSGWVESLYPAGVSSAIVAVADINADGIADIVVRANSAQKIGVLRGLVGGGFAPPVSYPAGFPLGKAIVADLSNDGFPDVAGALTLPAGAIAMFNNGGAFTNVPGLAGGDYFLDFNIANKVATDEDPVITLRTQFTAWRAALVGKTDAVQSTALLDYSHVDPDGTTISTLTITLRDYSGQPVVVPLADVVVTHAGGSLSTPGTLTANVDGTFSLPITPGTTCGVDRYRVTVNGSPRPVVLMPETQLVISTAADVNLDGAVNQNDSALFISWFESGALAADFNDDGFVDPLDYNSFLNTYEQGC